MMIKRRLRRIKDVWKVRQIQSPWSPLFQRYYGQELVSLDIETTSLDPKTGTMFLLGMSDNRGNSKILYADDDQSERQMIIDFFDYIELPRDAQEHRVLAKKWEIEKGDEE